MVHIQGCATFIFCFLHFSLFTVHFAVAFSPSAAYLRQGYSGVPDANQAKGCLRWGERRQSCALCRSATSDSAICRTRGFLFQQFSACEVPDRACSMGCTAAFPANVGVLCSGFPTPSVPCDRPAVRAVSCAGDFHEPVPSNPPQSYNKKKAPTTCGRLLALCGTKVPRKSLFWH